MKNLRLYAAILLFVLLALIVYQGYLVEVADEQRASDDAFVAACNARPVVIIRTNNQDWDLNACG